MDDAGSSAPDCFRTFSEEYAQALEALRAIELQADRFLAAGAHEQLHQFLERFRTLASQAGQRASREQLDNFSHWFAELAARAGRLERACRTKYANGSRS